MAPVLTVGRLRDRSLGWPGVQRVEVPFDLPFLRRRALRRALTRLARAASDRIVLHAWTPTAFRWALDIADEQVGVLAECDLSGDVAALVRMYRARPSAAVIRFVCATERARRLLNDGGVPPELCARVPEATAASDDSRQAASGQRRENPPSRPRFGLADDHAVILAVPPNSRRSGLFTATWAALLLHEVHSDVRLVIPERGPEVERCISLANAVRRSEALCTPGAATRLSDLLAICDAAIFLAVGDECATGLRRVVAAGLPLVTVQTPLTREIIPAGAPVRFCSPTSPRDGARELLKLLESNAPRGTSSSAFSPAADEMIAAYRGAYASLGRAKILQEKGNLSPSPTPRGLDERFQSAHS